MNSTKQIGDLVIRITKYLNLKVERDLKRYGLGMGQLQILMIFFANTKEVLSQSDLVKTLSVDKGNISRSVVKLLDKAYLEQDSENPRVYRLSTSGKLLKDEISVIFSEINSAMTAGLQEDELYQTLITMNRISKNLEDIL